MNVMSINVISTTELKLQFLAEDITDNATNSI